MHARFAALATLAIAPLSFAQAPPPADYRRLEIARFYCQSVPHQAGDERGCLSTTEPGKIIWQFPACGWARDQYEPATCTVRAVPNSSGQFSSGGKASCSNKKFEKTAGECIHALKLKRDYKGDITPVCVSMEYPARERKTGDKFTVFPPLGPIIRELADCPPVN